VKAVRSEIGKTTNEDLTIKINEFTKKMSEKIPILFAFDEARELLQDNDSTVSAFRHMMTALANVRNATGLVYLSAISL
jgi:hypothetical protein